MADFLLIHGSGHGAWAWRDVLPRLRDLGHEARAIDLPGHGDDRTPIEAVLLETYRDAVLSALGDRTIVVGHSMGGYPITAAAEAAPARIAALVYLCAYVPATGMSLADMRRAGPRQPLTPAIRRAEDGLSFTFDLGMARELFYHDCPDEAVEYALARLCRQPVLPQETPLDETFRTEALPRRYILCEDDRAIPPEYQAYMARGFRARDVLRIPTSHSPFFAAPGLLARTLDDIAESL
jgi:pimeloyl-ACP methyl ester carboxylesterase